MGSRAYRTRDTVLICTVFPRSLAEGEDDGYTGEVLDDGAVSTTTINVESNASGKSATVQRRRPSARHRATPSSDDTRVRRRRCTGSFQLIADDPCTRSSSVAGKVSSGGLEARTHRYVSPRHQACLYLIECEQLLSRSITLTPRAGS